MVQCSLRSQANWDVKFARLTAMGVSREAIPLPIQLLIIGYHYNYIYISIDCEDEKAIITKLFSSTNAR